ncbi:MAG: molecular chaperone DnaJ [Dehalococcoidia bacterium]|nr:molecular chaperone DnaJ [Dehalococcoidia bacterium]
MERRDYYEILGIERTAKEADVKRAYRSLAMRYHPDKNPEDPDASSRMAEINEAYAVLCDSEKRQRYDVYGHAGLSGYSQADIFGGVDFSSIFGEAGFGFGGGIFDGLFGGGRTRTRERRKASDLRYNLTLTLEEAATGIEQELEIPKRRMCTSCRGTGAKEGALETCSDCQGSGRMVQEQRSGIGVFRQVSVCSKCGGSGRIIKEPCSLCEGTGTLDETSHITVSIPQGVDTGHTIRIAGEGEPGDGGLEPGDLYVVASIEPHPVFQRRGDDLYIEKEIGIAQAALGTTTPVPCLLDEGELAIPPGTQTGSLFRLRGKGMPRLGSSNRGDLYVMTRTTTPQELTEEQKELLQKFQKIEARKSAL